MGGRPAPFYACITRLSLPPNYVITYHLIISSHANKAVTIGVLCQSVYMMVSAH